ncbi:MAG: hypothetical protein LUE17_09315, partial [Planctomycetaceae bacterium]|nr:hypothetical protein [Planctomycetaceae bacterium]
SLYKLSGGILHHILDLTKVKIPEPHPSAKMHSLKNYTSIDKDFKPLAIFNEFVDEDNTTYSLSYKLYCRREESKVPKSLKVYAPGLKMALENSQDRMEAYYRSEPSYVSHQPPEIIENNDFFTNSQDLVFKENDVLMRGYSLFLFPMCMMNYFKLGLYVDTRTEMTMKEKHWLEVLTPTH